MSFPQILLLSFHSDLSVLSHVQQSIAAAFASNSQISTKPLNEQTSFKDASKVEQVDGAKDPSDQFLSEDTPLQIKTKYYSASVILRSIRISRIPDRNAVEWVDAMHAQSKHSSIEAVIVMLEENTVDRQAESTQELQLVDALVSRIEPSVRILAVTLGGNKSEAKLETLMDWSLDREFELLFPFNFNSVSASPALLGSVDNDMSVHRIVESLTCHTWPNLERANGTRELKTASQVTSEVFGSSAQSDRENAENEIEGFQNDIEAFESICQKIQKVRDKAKCDSTTDFERREQACEVAMEFFKLLKLEDEELKA